MTNRSAFLEVTRAKLLVGSFAHAVLGLVLGAGSFSSLFSLWSGAFVVLHFSIASMGCVVNSMSDVQVDRRSKPRIAAGVECLGPSGMRTILTVQATLIVALMVAFAVHGLHLVVWLAAVGVIAAVSYSLEPFRLKRRGIVSGLPLLLGLYCLPSLGGWSVHRGDWPASFVIFVAVYALMNQGMTFVNTVEDHYVDEAEGIRTWSHILGPRLVLRLAPVLTALGLACPFAIALLRPDRVPLVWVLVACSVASIAWVTRDVARAQSVAEPVEGANRYGSNLAKWFVIARFPLIALGLASLAS